MVDKVSTILKLAVLNGYRYLLTILLVSRYEWLGYSEQFLITSQDSPCY